MPYRRLIREGTRSNGGSPLKWYLLGIIRYALPLVVETFTTLNSHLNLARHAVSAQADRLTIRAEWFRRFTDNWFSRKCALQCFCPLA